MKTRVVIASLLTVALAVGIHFLAKAPVSAKKQTLLSEMALGIDHLAILPQDRAMMERLVSDSGTQFAMGTGETVEFAPQTAVDQAGDLLPEGADVTEYAVTEEAVVLTYRMEGSRVTTQYLPDGSLRRMVTNPRFGEGPRMVVYVNHDNQTYEKYTM